MIQRCYGQHATKDRRAYSGCDVDPEWHSFMAFRAWMSGQEWENKHLDKDIIFPGNRTYSADTCVFVDHATNMLLTGCTNPRGEFPIGVHFSAAHGKFASQVHVGTGSQKRLGYFNDPLLAHFAWQIAKAEQLDAAAERQNDARVASALSSRANKLRLDNIGGVETLNL